MLIGYRSSGVCSSDLLDCVLMLLYGNGNGVNDPTLQMREMCGVELLSDAMQHRVCRCVLLVGTKGSGKKMLLNGAIANVFGAQKQPNARRPEERRVGKECDSTGKRRWSGENEK